MKILSTKVSAIQYFIVIKYCIEVEMLVRTDLLCSNILSIMGAIFVTLKIGKMSVCYATNQQPRFTTIMAAICNWGAQ